MAQTQEKPSKGKSYKDRPGSLAFLCEGVSEVQTQMWSLGRAGDLSPSLSLFLGMWQTSCGHLCSNLFGVEWGAEYRDTLE